MKSVGRTVILAVIVLSVGAAVRAQPFSLSSVSASNSFAGPGVQAVTDPVLPVIEMKNVPLGDAIRNLAGQAHVNLQIDGRLSDWWAMTDDLGRHTQEPLANFRWTNTTARAALFRLIHDQHLILDVDPSTMITRVTDSPASPGPPITPSSFESSNVVRTDIPLIEFEDVPLTVALENLARQAGINYILDPQIGYNQPDRYGQIRPEPVLSLRWENITAEHAFIAICQNYHLAIVRDTNTDVALIRVRDDDVNFVKPNFYADDTNKISAIPIIEFQEVPIHDILKSLAKKAQMKCIFSARIDPWLLGNEPLLSLRWENLTAKQAFAAICEDYDLSVVKYPISGIIEIEPGD